MIKFFSKIRFLLTHILPPTTIDLSDGTLKALKGLPGYEKIYLRNNVRTKNREYNGALSENVSVVEKQRRPSNCSLVTGDVVVSRYPKLYCWPSLSATLNWKELLISSRLSYK